MVFCIEMAFNANEDLLVFANISLYSMQLAEQKEDVSVTSELLQSMFLQVVQHQEMFRK